MIDDTIKNDMEQTEEVVATTTHITEPASEPKNIPEKEPDVIDVDLGFVEKKRFRIAGDYNRMLELNVSDLNVFARLKEGYPKLQKLMLDAHQKIMDIPEDMDDKEELLGKLADALTAIDKEMRDWIDFIFNAEVSKVVAPSGNMYDPVGGQYRFERVIDIVTGLYTNGLHAEFDKMKNKVEKKTSKYTKKSKK